MVGRALTNNDCGSAAANRPAPDALVAVLGVVWFLGFLGIGAAHARWPHAGAAGALVAWSTMALVAVFGLIYAELFLIGAICLWCMP